MRRRSTSAERARSASRRARRRRSSRRASSIRRAASRTSRSSIAAICRQRFATTSDRMSTDATSVRRSARGIWPRRNRAIAPGSRARSGTVSTSARSRRVTMPSWRPACAAAPCSGRRYRACDEISRSRSAMPKRPPNDAADLIPDHPTLSAVRAASRDCQACDLWKRGTQTVFGEGGPEAEVMFVGEQPGDAEDLAGRPFVGPAGKLLDRVLAEVGIDRTTVYVTNVVKHFKWEPRGKRRIHKKPNAGEIAACRPWLDAEIELVRPRALVCLGATAAQARLGRAFKLTANRGAFVPSSLAPLVLATVHPSSILRAPDAEARRRETERFTEDLRLVVRALRGTHQ